jgi:hypothetical protein
MINDPKTKPMVNQAKPMAEVTTVRSIKEDILPSLVGDKTIGQVIDKILQSQDEHGMGELETLTLKMIN